MDEMRKRYVMRFMWGIVLYVILVLLVPGIMERVPDTAWVYLMALVPVVPALIALFAYVGFLRTLDEMQRKIQFEAFSFGFGATALFTLTYGLLQEAGLPQTNWVTIPSFMVLFWWAGYTLARRRYR